MSVLQHSQDHSSTRLLEAPTPDTGTANDERSGLKGHVGRIVVGSMAAGLLGAIAVVAGPLAGAREHLVTGSVLLVFAAVWAAMAFLTDRRTDQPQLPVPAESRRPRRASNPL